MMAPTVSNSGTATPMMVDHRHGPRATMPAPASRMIGPGGMVGYASDPDPIWSKIPPAATIMAATFRLAGVDRPAFHH